MEKHIVRTFFRLATVLIVATTFSNNLFATTVTALDLSAWDASRLSADEGFQHFENVAGDLDVTVTALGDFDAPSRFVSTLDGGTDAIATQHNPSDVQECHSYVFEFSGATDLVLETESLDAQEEYLISSNGGVSYNNVSGVEPTISQLTNSIVHLDGVAFGRDPISGSSDGVTFISAPESGSTSVTVSYCADPTLHSTNLTKFGSFTLSAVSAEVDQLPEPGSFSLFGLGAIAVLLSRRSRRS